MKQFTFDTDEWSAIAILAGVVTIFLIFVELFRKEISVSIVLSFGIFFFISIFFVVFMHELGHKITAEYLGYAARIQLFKGGLIASIIITFYAFGRIPFITPNQLQLDAIPKKRLSKKFRYDNPSQQAYIATAGIIGSVLAISVLRILYEVTQYEPFMTVIYGALVHAVYGLIPIEFIAVLKLRFFNKIQSDIIPSDGLYIIRYSLILWVFLLSFILIYGFLIQLLTTGGLVASLLLAGIITLLFSLFKE